MSNCPMCKKHVSEGYSECPICGPFYRAALAEKRYEVYGLQGYMYTIDAWAALEKIEMKLREGALDQSQRNREIKLLTEKIIASNEELQRRYAAEDRVKQDLLTQLRQGV